MIDPPILIALFAAASAVAVALIGWLQHRGSKAADMEASNVQTEINLLRSRLDVQQEEIDTLKTQMEQVQAERDALWRENRDLRDENRDQAELIDDVMAHFVDMATWTDLGAIPPPPVHSWRIRAAIAEYRARREHPPTHRQGA